MNEQLHANYSENYYSLGGQPGEKQTPQECYGRSQSPIDLKQTVKDGALPELQLAYKACRPTIVNTGYTMRVDYGPGSFLSWGQQRYQLGQFHFHSPGEHEIEGHIFAMELHLVHQSQDGKTAVLAVMLDLGEENPVLTQLWSRLPSGEWEVRPELEFNVAQVLPASRHYYTYQGSLTTPPYTEGVLWLVLKQPVTLSKNQLRKFQAIVPPNNRLLQPLNKRVIKEK